MPRFSIGMSNVSDFDQAKPLLRAHLQIGCRTIMDKGYNSDAIRAYVNQLGRRCRHSRKRQPIKETSL